MSMDDKKYRYLNATLPEAVKEAKERSSLNSDERMKKLEDSIAALADMMAKSNRDNLDAIYNLDADNFSPAFKKQVKAWANESGEGFEILSQRITDAVEALADYKQEVTDTYATTSMLSQYITSNAAEGLVNQAKSEIQTYADSTFATTSMLSQYVTSGEVASTVESAVRTYADGRYASVESLASITTTNPQTGKNEVTAASIVLAVNRTGSAVQLNANKISLDGDVYLSDKYGENIRVYNNRIKMNLPAGVDGSTGTAKSKSYLSFIYDGFDDANEIGYVRAEHGISGSDVDTGFELSIGTRKFGTQQYRPDISIEAAGFVNLWAHYAVTANGNYDFTELLADYYSGAIDEMPDNTYFFCADGIFFHTTGDGLRKIDWSWTT